MNENPQRELEVTTDPTDPTDPADPADPADLYLEQIENGNVPKDLDAKMAEANKTFADLQNPGKTTIVPETQKMLLNHIKNGESNSDLDIYLSQILREMRQGNVDVTSIDSQLLELLNSKNLSIQESTP